MTSNCMLPPGNDDEHVDSTVAKAPDDSHDMTEGKLNMKGERPYSNTSLIIRYAHPGKATGVIFNGCPVGCVTLDGMLLLYGVDMYGLLVATKLSGKSD